MGEGFYTPSARPARAIGSIATTITRWLVGRRLHGEDRRSAVVLQLLAILLLIDVPLTVWGQLRANGMRLDTAGVRLILESLVVAVPALATFLLTLGGRYRAGAIVLLCAWSLSLLGSYVSTGMLRVPHDFSPVPVLFIAGYILGRRTLWIALGIVACALGGAVLADILRDDTADIGASVLAATTRFAVIACAGLIFDQTIVRLKSTLADAQRKGERLQSLSESLALEIRSHKDTQQRMSHLQRIDAASRLAVGLAHDMGNLLNIVIGYATQREMRADRGVPALVGALERIEQATLRASRLNARLMDLGRSGPVEHAALPLSGAIEAILPMVRQTVGDGVEVVVSASCDATVRFDATQFDLIVINFAANARDAMPGGGRLTIGVVDDAHQVRLTFEDTGRGMPPDVVERVFEPFFSTKERSYGLGLGLTLVRDMVQEAGGSVTLRSTSDAGTCFEVTLPRMMGDEEVGLSHFAV